MQKPALFIGCSKENLAVANALHQALTFDAECSIWDQGTFRPSDYPLESLESAIEASDFAVFIFIPDDTAVMRDEKIRVVRDNVLFELGISIGKIGRKRTFVAVPRGVDVHIPTDLKGWTPVEFESSRSDGSLRAAMAPVATELKEAFQLQGIRPRASLPAVVEEPVQHNVDQPLDFWTEYLTPKPDWTFEQLRQCFAVAIALDRSEDVSALSEFFAVSEFAKDDERTAEWEGTNDEERLTRGQNVALKSFRDRADRFEGNALLQNQFADALSYYGDHANAQKVLEKAAKCISDFADRGNALVRAAKEARSAGTKVSLRSYLSIVGEIGREEENTQALLTTLKDLAAQFELVEIELALSEELVLLQADDISLRFDLAFGYAELERDDLAILHYEGIPAAQRSASVFNNLGVAYSKISAPGLAVQNYEAAVSKGASVATGNLADKLIKAGFYEKAQEVAEAALKMPDHDDHVDKILPTVQEAKIEEQTKARSAIDSGKASQLFMRSLGRAAAKYSNRSVEGEWQTPECKVLFEYDEGEEIYVASGKYTKQSEKHGFGFSLFGPIEASREVTLECKMRRIGDAFEGTIERRTGGNSVLSVLGMGNVPKRITMILAEDCEKLIVKDRNDSASEEIWVKVTDRIVHAT